MKSLRRWRLQRCLVPPLYQPPDGVGRGELIAPSEPVGLGNIHGIAPSDAWSDTSCRSGCIVRRGKTVPERGRMHGLVPDALE